MNKGDFGKEIGSASSQRVVSPTPEWNEKIYYSKCTVNFFRMKPVN